MEEVLAELLKRLAVIEEEHGELTDTDVREKLDAAVRHGFLVPVTGYQLPDHFAMFTPEGNREVREVLAWFLPTACAAAAVENLDTFHKRLAAFQNLEVTFGPERMDYNDFFGWRNPELFDETGNVISRTRKLN